MKRNVQFYVVLKEVFFCFITKAVKNQKVVILHLVVLTVQFTCIERSGRLYLTTVAIYGTLQTLQNTADPEIAQKRFKQRRIILRSQH